jgi:hypothetical protein
VDFSCREVIVQPSLIGKDAQGIHNTISSTVIKVMFFTFIK